MITSAKSGGTSTSMEHRIVLISVHTPWGACTASSRTEFWVQHSLGRCLNRQWWRLAFSCYTPWSDPADISRRFPPAGPGLYHSVRLAFARDSAGAEEQSVGSTLWEAPKL